LQFEDQGRTERVQRLRTVQGDDADGAPALYQDVLEAHAYLPRFTWPPPARRGRPHSVRASWLVRRREREPQRRRAARLRHLDFELLAVPGEAVFSNRLPAELRQRLIVEGADLLGRDPAFRVDLADPPARLVEGEVRL